MSGVCWVPILIIFGEMHFLLISENEFTHEMKCNRITSFKEFMKYVVHFGISYKQRRLMDG